MYAPYKLFDFKLFAPSKPRTFTPDLAGLIAWLETQDGATEYDHKSVDDCLLCRFASVVVGRKLRWTQALEALSQPVFDFTDNKIWSAAHGVGTYAAALLRARSLASTGSDVG